MARAAAAGFIAWLVLGVAAIGAAQGAPQLATAPEAAVGEVVSFARTVELAAVSSGVAAAQAQLELARLSFGAAHSPISASASGGLTGSTGFSEESTTVGLDLSVNASLRVGWGATAESAASATRSLAAAEAAVETARSAAVVSAVRLYGTAVSAATSRDVAQVQLEVARLQAEGARSRFEAGAALATDVTQAELSETSAELELTAAEAAVAAAYTDLSLALGVNVTGVAGDLPDVAWSAEAARPAGAQATDEVVAARSDVQAAQRDLEAAADALQQARRASGVSVSASASLSASGGGTSASVGASMSSADLTPNLTGRFSTSGSPFGGGSGQGQTGTDWRASVSVSANVPLGPADTKVASAEVAYAQAQTKLAGTIASARVEIFALEAQVMADAAQVAVADTRAELAKTAEETVRTRFELGAVGQVEVLQAQASGLQAAGQARTARLNHLLDLMSLARATGLAVTEVLR